MPMKIFQLILLLFSIESTFAKLNWGVGSASHWVYRIRGGAEVAQELSNSSASEVKDKLDNVPVFTVTDEKGQFLIFKEKEDGANIVWLFLQPDTATAVKEQAQSADVKMNYKVSIVPLGAVWEKLTSAGGTSAEEVDVEWRLMPSQPDLAFARNVTVQHILTTDFAKSNGRNLLDRLYNGTTAEKEEAKLEVDRIVSNKLGPLNSSWGVVPVFTISAMKIRIDGKEVRPWFLSREDCERQWQGAVNSSSEESEELESLGRLHMTTLQDLVAAMLSPSLHDFGSIILIPSTESSIYIQEQMKQVQTKTETKDVNSLFSSNDGEDEVADLFSSDI